MIRKFLVILAMVMFFGATAAFAGEQVPRTGREVKIVYDEVFLPPHSEARYELDRIQEEWSAQELFDLISRQEESDEENF